MTCSLDCYCKSSLVLCTVSCDTAWKDFSSLRKMKSTTIRMDDDLKKEASAKLEALGLNFNTYVVMATKQLVAQNRIPFDLVVPDARSESEDKREEAC